MSPGQPLPGEWSTISAAPPPEPEAAESGSQSDSEPLRASLRTAHREILRRVFLGEPLNEVAVAVGMPYATVRYITRSPLFQAALAEMQTEADGKVIDTAQRMRMERALTDAAESGIPVAFKAMNESQSPATRAKIAFGFLDRAGLSPSRKVEEKREGFREMLERLDEMERHMSPGSEVTAEVKFSVRKEGENGYHAGVSPAAPRTVEGNESESATVNDPTTVQGRNDPVAFLRQALGTQ
jgi:hypothetical protein